MATAMAKRHHLEELADLPEDRALELHLSELCWGRLAWWMRLSLIVLVVWFISTLEGGHGWRDALPILEAAVLAFYFVGRRLGLEKRPFLRYGFPLLLAQMALVRMATFGMEGESFGPFDFFLPGLLLVFPLPFLSLLTLYAIFWLPTALASGMPSFLSGGESSIAEPVAFSIYLGMLFLSSRFLYRRRVAAFVESWQRARGWALEGRRMRNELDQARRIQLSMLPQSDPYSDWLDIAGTSRPATEVGGDYYGFFELGAGRQAVVVADVSGHGVASGLLLAGVRGCLVMLHDGGEEAVPAPQGVLARLDGVVRTVGGRRTFVTMVYTLFERSPPRLTVAAAGHPPVLRWRPGAAAVEEIAQPSLPLGTTLSKSFPQTTVGIEPGDVLVFATDGIAEAAEPRGSLFGEERLHAALRRSALGATAAEIRDAMLAELEAFLGAGEVQDDVTLVVVRIKA